MLATAGATTAAGAGAGKKRIAASAVASVFGIELDDSSLPAKKSAEKKAAAGSKRPVNKEVPAPGKRNTVSRVARR